MLGGLTATLQDLLARGAGPHELATVLLRLCLVLLGLSLPVLATAASWLACSDQPGVGHGPGDPPLGTDARVVR